MTQEQAAAERGFDYLAVYSGVTVSGRYLCTLALGSKTLRTLERDAAAAYVAEVTWAVTCAEYDAAVLRQLIDAKMDPGLMAHIILALRNDRRPVVASATTPLRFTPIVSNRDRVARLSMRLEGSDRDWTWELDTARQHVQQVMEVVAGVDLDAAYFRYLRNGVGLDEEEARTYVRMLREHMPGLTDTSDTSKTPPGR